MNQLADLWADIAATAAEAEKLARELQGLPGVSATTVKAMTGAATQAREIGEDAVAEYLEAIKE